MTDCFVSYIKDTGDEYWCSLNLYASYMSYLTQLGLPGQTPCQRIHELVMSSYKEVKNIHK